jgi:hypothetical protein
MGSNGNLARAALAKAQQAQDGMGRPSMVQAQQMGPNGNLARAALAKAQQVGCAANGSCPFKAPLKAPAQQGCAANSVAQWRDTAQWKDTMQAPVSCGAAKAAQMRNALQSPCGAWSNTLSINRPAPLGWKSARTVEPGITIDKNYHPTCYSNEFPTSDEFQWYPKTFNYAEPAPTPSCPTNRTYASAMESQAINTFKPTSYAALF